MKKFAGIYIALVLTIIYIPIVVLVLFSFNSTSNTGVFSGFSLYWYKELFSSSDSFEALKNTLILALSSGVASTIIGTAAAVGMDRMRNKAFKTALNSVTNVPMMNPEIVTGVSMMLLFVAVGTMLGLTEKLSFITLFIAHVTFELPYVILNVMPRVKNVGTSIPNAAMDLGCTPVQSFFKVELPLIMPGVVSGFIMAFTLSLDDFVISYFTNGNDFQTLPLLIYSMTKKEVKPDIYALSTLMIFAILILLVVSNILSGRDERKKAKIQAAKAAMANKAKNEVA